jgi:hypothetical protein
VRFVEPTDEVVARQDKVGTWLLWFFGLVLAYLVLGFATCLVPSKWQPSPLELAVQEDRFTEFQELVKGPIDLGRECMTTKGAFGSAMRLKRYSYAEAMLAAGCPINPQGEAHLSYHTLGGRTDQVRWLLDHGANPDYQPETWRKTPREIAQSDPEMKKIFAER